VLFRSSRVPNVAVVGESSRTAAEARGFRVELVAASSDGASLFVELRERILHVELEAERLQQDALERLASNAPPAKNDCDPRTALRGLTTDGSAPSQTFEEIFSPLIKALAVR